MKTIQILCGLLFLTSLSFAQKSFEGTINYKHSELEEVTTLVEVDGKEVEKTEKKKVTYLESTFFIKEKEVILEVTTGDIETVLYLDQETNEIVMYYLKLDGTGEIVRNPIDFFHEERIEPELSTTKTGNSKMIGKYLCFEYNVKASDKVLGTIWAAPALQLNIAEIPFFNLPTYRMSQFIRPIKGVDGFILAIESTNEQKTDLEITVTEKEIDDARFIIPAITKKSSKE